MNKGALINRTKFTGKHLCQGLFFNKFAGLGAATLLKKKLWHFCFPLNFAKFLRTHSLQNTSVWLFLNLFLVCFLYFTLSKIFATKKVASCEKSWLVENWLNDLEFPQWLPNLLIARSPIPIHKREIHSIKFYIKC